jgi:hypothetical protein
MLHLNNIRHTVTKDHVGAIQTSVVCCGGHLEKDLMHSVTNKTHTAIKLETVAIRNLVTLSRSAAKSEYC